MPRDTILIALSTASLTAGEPLPAVNKPWTFENAQVARVATPAGDDFGGFDPKSIGLERDKGALAVVYLPPGIATYRGIWISDTNSRYETGHLASVLEFAVVRHNWYFQDQFYEKISSHEPADPVDDGWLARFLKDLAVRTGHPELEHAPLLFSPKQAGDQSIVRHALKNMPGRVLAVSYGFGDSGLASKQGIPCSTANEVRNNPDFWTLSRFTRAPGQLLAAASEQGYEMHWSNSKPYIGNLMFQSAVLARLPFDRHAINGPVPLRALTEESGWLGDTTPGMTSQWRMIAPATSYKGDKAKTSWMIDDICAAAWRGYLTYNPPVTIVAPNMPFGMGDMSNHVFKQSPLPPGKVTIRIEPTTRPTGRPAANLLAPDPSVAARITSVRIMEGARELGVIAGAKGSITVELGPGMHVLVPECAMDDGTFMGGWPVGVLISGNIYAEAQRQTLPAKLAAAKAAGDLPTMIATALILRAIGKPGDTASKDADAALAEATPKADKAIAAIVATADSSGRGAPLVAAIATWGAYPAGSATLAAARDRIAEAKWANLARNAKSLLDFHNEWSGSPAAAKAMAAYDELAKAAYARLDAAAPAPKRAADLSAHLKAWDRRAPSLAAAQADYETAVGALLTMAKAEKDAARAKAMYAEIARVFPDTRAGVEAAGMARK